MKKLIKKFKKIQAENNEIVKEINILRENYKEIWNEIKEKWNNILDYINNEWTNKKCKDEAKFEIFQICTFQIVETKILITNQSIIFCNAYVNSMQI